MCGSQRLAEPRDDVAQTPTLGLQLVEPRLQLEGHLVERPAEQRELVTSLHGHTFLQIAARDGAGRVDEAANRAHDRTALHIRDTSDEDEGREQADEQAIRGVPVRRIDLGLRCDHAERRCGLFLEGPCNESAVLGPGERDRVRPAQGQLEEAARLRGPGDDSAALDQDHVIVLFEPGPSLEAAYEPGVEGDRSDHGAANTSRTENVDPAGHGQGSAPADPEAAGRLHCQVGPGVEDPRECSPVALEEGTLKRGGSGQLAGGRVGRPERLLIGGQGRPQPGLQACVDTPRLAPRCNR